MRKIFITGFMVCSFLISGLGSAASASAEEVCTKERGTVTCTTTEPVGNSHNTKESSTSQKGSFNSSHDPSCTYTNPSGKTRQVDC